MKTQAPSPSPLVVNGRTAACMLGIGERTLARMVSDGSIPSVKLGGRRLFRVAALEEYLADLERRQAGLDTG